MESVELISETVGGGETGEVDKVLNGLYYGFRLSDLSEHGNSGPMTQLRQLHGHGVSVFFFPEGSVILTWAQDTPPSLSVWTSDEDTGEQYFCGV